jgi:S-adenosylmethionine synthetase
MKSREYAEYVSPGHPDRLADAIAEKIVEQGCKIGDQIITDSKSLIGVEVAVHNDTVFIDGRVALDKRIPNKLRFESLVKEVYKDAGYQGNWLPDPESLEIITRVCEEVMPDEEEDIRPFSDDQNIVMGYSTSNKLTNGLPIAHWLALTLGPKIKEFQKENSDKFGPDFKILVDINCDPNTIEWNNLTLSILHLKGIDYHTQLSMISERLKKALKEIEALGLEGSYSTFNLKHLILNGNGEFTNGGPIGDNGLSGKKLVIDHYGPSIAIGGGAMVGKDPWKVDRCGQLRARQLAKRIVQRGYYDSKVTLTWSPGGEIPTNIQAQVRHDQHGDWMDLDNKSLPPPEWFSIAEIVKSQELWGQEWSKIILEGNFTSNRHIWEN